MFSLLQSQYQQVMASNLNNETWHLYLPKIGLHPVLTLAIEHWSIQQEDTQNKQYFLTIIGLNINKHLFQNVMFILKLL